MNFQNKTNINWELTIAEPEDSQGIQKVFDDGDFKGGISVTFSRQPDPYRSLQNDGEHTVILVAKDKETNEIFGTGGCVIRREYVNGILRNTGYLTGLKILRSHRKRFNCIIPAYKMIKEQTAVYNPFYYTTILADNENAVKLLEKPRKNMPSYNYIGNYTVYCFGVGGKPKRGDFSFVRGHTDELAVFYKENLPKYNLSPKDEWLYGLKSEDFYYLKSTDGEILASCAIWNQQSYKQYIISGYNGIYKTISHIPIGLLGYPIMPKAGTSANYSSMSVLIIPEQNMDIAGIFLKFVLHENQKYDFVMLGLFENHPLNYTAKKFRHIKYQSRLYTVDYAGNKSEHLFGSFDGRPIMLEVGLL